MKETFKKEHIDEKVNCLMRGNGRMISFGGVSRLNPVGVDFESLRHKKHWYTVCGAQGDHCNPTLSFGHKEPVEFDYGKPELAYVPLEFDGSPLWCWVSDDRESVVEWAQKGYVVSGNSEIGFMACDKGMDNTKTNKLHLWRFAMAIPESIEKSDEVQKEVSCQVRVSLDFVVKQKSYRLKSGKIVDCSFNSHEKWDATVIGHVGAISSGARDSEALALIALIDQLS